MGKSVSNKSFDTLVGAGMLFVATAVFVYYTTWTLVLVSAMKELCEFKETVKEELKEQNEGNRVTRQIYRVHGRIDTPNQPFVDEPHFLYSFFPPREWAIRIPVILLLVGSTIIGSFIGVVLLRAAKEEKLKQQAKKTK